ncbi:MAG TPA: tRNA lysidine(34) synthetase TilS [Ktedonobacteraceae bacterium]|nr:tRNA lysidine(34) synthetase TilS [Ktedonobacteraceae bacterium]
MLDTIATYIEHHHLLPQSGTIIVAVSGGADSLCLLHILNRLCGSSDRRYPHLRLHVAHLNHKLRGEASAQDAACIAQLAASWGLPVTIGEIDVHALAQQEQRSLEDAARVARYRFLREVAQGQPIAVAHHADDQVETLLLHWLRGGGLAGMVGMLPRQQDIIRPLLEVSHAQTVAYCQQHELVPLEDASNTDPRFLRNRIRHQLLPLLESMNPGIRATLLRNAGVIHVDVQWIEAEVDSYWPSIVVSEGGHNIRLDSSALLALPLSLQRHLLRRVTAQLCAGQSPLELRHYLLVEQLLQRDQPGVGQTITLDLPDQLHVTRDFNSIIFERLSHQVQPPVFSVMDKEMLLPIPGCIVVQGTPWIASADLVAENLAQKVREALLRDDWSEVWRLLPSTRHTIYIDADSAGSLLQVRTRRPGDRIRPLGMAHEKKVQDVLVNERIARADRPYIPLFFSTSHCVWLAGVQIDDRVRLTNKTQRIVRLSIESALKS